MLIGLVLQGMLLASSLADPTPLHPKPAVSTSVETTDKASDKANITANSPQWRLPHERNRRSLNQIYAFDRHPLGRRIPVILVPGRAEEFQEDSWWRRLHKACSKDPDFRKRFKTYVFLYNSKDQLDVQAQSLGQDLRRRFSSLPPEQPLMLVTYSLGGVISREVLKDNDILRQVDTMIAIAVPFHGSPLFDPDWFTKYLNPPNRSPIRRFWDHTVYRGYMFGKSNLVRGLKWDNFDSSKPQFQAGERQIRGDQAHSAMHVYQEYLNADVIRHKTIVYAGFLVNGHTRTNQTFRPLKLPGYVLNHSLAFPRQVVASLLPFYGFTVHSVFGYMNYQMANLPTYTPEDPQGRNTHLYRFNDGAIPVSSMLFLKPRSQPYDEDIQRLAELAEVRKSRVFVDLDHLHLGEYSIRKSRLARADMLHPLEGKATPNAWIIRDLLNRAETAYPLMPISPSATEH